jgi:hypothetical protein
MPAPVCELFAAAALEPQGSVRWGERVPEQQHGVYVVSLGEKVDEVQGLPAAPLSAQAVRRLLATRPELALDGRRPNENEVADRIGSFWLSDETVLYVGLAGTSLRARVRAYYKTPLGARRPHAGGWFLKMLANLDELFVHYSKADNPMAAEDAMLGFFCSNVSRGTLSQLPDPAHPFPFANLEWPRGIRKAHGIKGARGD